MENLKKPETVISLVNTAALLGASVYFYRRIGTLETEIDKYSEHLTAIVDKVQELQLTKQHVRQITGAIREINNIVSSQRNEINYLRSLSSFQSDQIKEIHENSSKGEDGPEYKLVHFPYPDPIQVSYAQQNQGYQQGYQNRPQQQYNQQGYNQPGYNQRSNQGPNQQYSNSPPQQQRFNQPQSYNQPQNQGYNQSHQQRFNSTQGYNQPQNQPQGYNQPQNQPQGYNQQGYNQPQNGGDLLNFSNSMEEDDLESEIAAVRQARQMNNNEVLQF